MSGGFYGPEAFGSSPFDEFMARLYGGGGGQSRPGYRVDIMRLMSQQARELVGAAAAKATEHGGSDLGTEQLLWAAATVEPTRQLLARAGTDPDAIARAIEEHERERRGETGSAGDGGPGQGAGGAGPGGGLADPGGGQDAGGAGQAAGGAQDAGGAGQAAARGPGSGEGGRAADGPPQLTPGAKRALLDAHQISRSIGSTYIGPEHILFALAVNPESAGGRILSAARVTPESLRDALLSQGLSPGQGGPGRPGGRSATPTLDEFGRDLTALAREGRIDPVIRRDDEIAQTVEVLSRRTKNNPVLIGEAGVGKTAIVEGIAQRIVDDEVPQTLTGKRVLELELSSVVAGTRYRGDFEERVKRLVGEIREHSGELIVFIDELHTIVGAGGSTEGGIDAGNMLKAALARGELHIVGATTLDEYRKNVERDAALARRFQPVLVTEPSVDDAITILHGLRDRYEAHHQVRYTDGALVAAVELSDRYISDRFLPDKAIDLIDQAGARVRLRTRTPGAGLRALECRAEELHRDKDQAVANEQYERASQIRDQIKEVEQQLKALRTEGPEAPEVTASDIAEVVSRVTGVPVHRLTEEEKERLLLLEDHLHGRIVGQDEAVEAVAEAVRRSRAGLGDPNRPVGSFLFLGPTGVGKTELARALAEALFGSESRMIRLDMSEYSERHTVSRLVGAPPGYVGYEEAGQLTESVRRRPYSVVLLDEIEKAHPDVFNILLQILDDGRLTDGQGRTVDFKNTVLIMTSNLGSDVITRRAGPLGFAGSMANSVSVQQDAVQEQLMWRLRESFRPEFLNRIDEIIIFRQLDRTELRQVTELLLEETRRRLHAQDVLVQFTQAAVDWIAEHGFQPEFGARPMRRTIQREVDNHLSRMLLDGDIEPGQEVTVDVGNGGLTFGVHASAMAQNA
jgi:ATP-dependent Clp protease ATP-binding subunit ClpC